MSKFEFMEIWKIVIFTNFTCIWPFCWKLSKNVIFWYLKKHYLDIKRLHHGYSEVSLRPAEQISRHISEFGPHAAKYGSIWQKKWQNPHMATLVIFKIKKSIFLKVADIVREIDIWPENDILGVLEWFGSLIWYLESSRTNFEKIEKNRTFWIFDLWVTTMSGSKFRPIGRKSAE